MSARLLVVAPPGSGKTVLGLYVWTDLVRKPALVLSPNSAIQSQWVARAEELFELDGRESELSTTGKEPGILTSLTYQSVTMPQPRDEGLDPEAMELWVNDLIDKSEAEDEEQARACILDLRDSNDEVFNERRSFYRKKVRDDSGRPRQRPLRAAFFCEGDPFRAQRGGCGADYPRRVPPPVAPLGQGPR